MDTFKIFNFLRLMNQRNKEKNIKVPSFYKLLYSNSTYYSIFLTITSFFTCCGIEDGSFVTTTSAVNKLEEIPKEKTI